MPASADDASAPRASVSAVDFDRLFSAASLARLAAATRLASCFAALYVVLLAWRASERAPLPLAPLLMLFAAYCAGLYWRAVRARTAPPGQWVQWLDAMWILAFVALSGGPHSVFSLFLLFPILFVSIGHGFRAGMAMSGAISLLLLGIGLLMSGTMPEALADAFLPCGALLVLGYLIATWAASGLAMGRRLAFLKQVNALFNPRLGIEQMVDLAVRRLTTLYRIDSYALAVSGSLLPYAVRARLPGAMTRLGGPEGKDLTAMLLAFDLNEPRAWRRRVRLRLRHRADCASTVPRDRRLAADLAVLLECRAFCAVEIRLRHGVTARLFLCSNHQAFGAEDLRFLRQLGEQISHPIESVQLLDALAREVADHERRRISRDLHDSAIQPYIGFKFALEALARRIGPANPIAADVRRLAELVGNDITELRRLVRSLRDNNDVGRAALLPAVHRQARRFAELYGVRVEVEATDLTQVGDALADEVYHMIAEALSNVRRHTAATRAVVSMACSNDRFVLKVTNPGDAHRPTRGFQPRSISERSRALGGHCRVEFGAQGETVVVIDVPLSVAPRALADVHQLAQAARTVLHAA